MITGYGLPNRGKIGNLPVKTERPGFRPANPLRTNLFGCGAADIRLNHTHGTLRFCTVNSDTLSETGIPNSHQNWGQRETGLYT